MTGSETVTISTDQDLLTTIERFEVGADQQAKAVDAAAASIGQLKQNEAFVGALVLSSLTPKDAAVRAWIEATGGMPADGFAVVAQWRRPPQGDVPTAPGRSQSVAHALHEATLVDARTYELDFSSLADSVTPPMRVSLPSTPLAHFGIFSMPAERQEKLLEVARADSPRALVIDGLLSVNFYRSLDRLQVINLGVWTTFEGLAELASSPHFRQGDQYWDGIADFNTVQFEIVAVASA